MSSGKFNSKNSKAIYLIAIIVIIVAFLLLGGGPWTRGMMHGNYSVGMTHFNWFQILISLGVGFLLGILFARRR